MNNGINMHPTTHGRLGLVTRNAEMHAPDNSHELDAARTAKSIKQSNGVVD